MGELGKLIVALGFEKLPKIQLIAQSGHTALIRYSLTTGRAEGGLESYFFYKSIS